MALGKNSTKMRNTNVVDKKLGVVRNMGAMGKKRVVVFRDLESFSPDSVLRTPVKQTQCFKGDSPIRTPVRRTPMSYCFNAEEGSMLEALPQDILVKIICGVDHGDLNRLYQVSKTVHEAALIAKQWHFAFTTPSSRPSRASTDLDHTKSIGEPPNCLKRQRDMKSRMYGKKLSEITIALFHSDEELLSNGLMEIDI